MSAVHKRFVRNLWVLLIMVGLGGIDAVNGQTGTTRGKEFYISMMPNGSSVNDNQFRVYFATLVEANVELLVGDSAYFRSFLMTPNSSYTLEIEPTLLPAGAEIKENIGIYIRSDAEISVYAVNEANATSDGAMVLPYASLGDFYMVHSYNVPPPQTSVTPQQFSVLATEDSTMVDITFSAPTILQNTITHQAGESITVELMQGEQIIYFSREDLSGTTVRARPGADGGCKKIAVFSGHVASLVGTEQGPDHLYEQMYPVADWGKEYIALPFETRFAGEPVKVLASEDNTTLTYGAITTRLDRGESVLFEVIEPTYIQADRPVSVLQMTKGRAADNTIRGDGFADPFMINLSPVNQTVNELAFILMTNLRMERHFVNVVTPTANLAVFLNDQDISNRFAPVPGKPEFSHASFSLNPTFHRMSSPNGFVAHAYAFGEAESLGYALGGDLGDFRVTITDEQQGVVSISGETALVCQVSELTFNVSSDIPALKDTYTEFLWDMGDGTLLYGDEVKHEYVEPGNYSVRLTASKSVGGCSNLFLDREIEIVPDGIEGIQGPHSVCPDAQDIEYNAVGTLADYGYEWFVDGGVIDGNRFGSSVVIDWSIADENARVRILARSPNGCLSDTLELPIVLNEFLEPAQPNGPAQLCSADLTGNIYSTPLATGSTYTWVADGGTIRSGQGTNRVTVDWSGVGTHAIWFTESTQTSSNLCDGTSPDLPVTVYEPLSAAEEMTPVSCAGESDGEVRLEISGGLGPYEVTWDNGDKGPFVAGRSAGIYRYTIVDALGCELEQEVEVIEPDQLTGFMEVQNAVCNGFRGFAIANISGGTAPYAYDWGEDITTNSSRADGLSKGTYSVRVTDANDCEINLNFKIEEPTALEAAFTMEQACPGAADGSLTLSVSGGVEPYNFVWEFSPSVNSSTLDGITDGTYRVTIVDGAGCEKELTGLVTNQTPRISIPTAFSPNNDEANDEFRAVYNCALDFRMNIYNRWGTTVFVSNNIDQGWDGTFEGNPAPVGTYTYEVVYGGVFNGTPFTETVRGYLKIVR